MAVTNLSQYFQSIGKPLPSVQQRRSTYGLGTDYVGTAYQNAALLAKLVAGGASAPSSAPVPVAPAAPAPQTTPQFIESQFNKVPSAESLARQEGAVFEGRVKEAQTPLNLASQELVTALQGRSNIEDLYKQLRSERGVDTTEALIRNIEKSAVDTTGLLENLPKDLLARSQGLPILESQRSAIQAKESSNLSNIIRDLLRGSERERAGLDLVMRGIQDALGIRQLQEERGVEPSRAKLGFAERDFGTSVDSAKTLLANILSGGGVDISKALNLATTLTGERVGRESEERQLAASKEIARANRAAGGGFPNISFNVPTTPEAPAVSADISNAFKRDVGRFGAVKELGFPGLVKSYASLLTLKQIYDLYEKYAPKLLGAPKESFSTISDLYQRFGGKSIQ